MAKAKTDTPAYTVKVRFQQHRDYGGKSGEDATFYEVGDDVSHFDQERLNRAVELGLVEHNKAENEAE